MGVAESYFESVEKENDYENEKRERWEAGAEGRAVGARLTPSIRVYFGSIGDSMTSIPFRQEVGGRKLWREGGGDPP